MLTSKAKCSANAATTFGLATTVAALWMAAVPPAIQSARNARRPFTSAAVWPTSGVMHIGTAWSNVASRSNLKGINERSRLFVGAIISPWRRWICLAVM
jgi:hypothetical protein